MLSREEAQARLEAFADHPTFCRQALRIRGLDGVMVPMEPSPGQLRLNAAIQKQRQAGKPVRLVVLKTRRSWFTAGSCAQFFHAIPFLPGTKGLVIADRYRPAALEAFGYLKDFHHHYWGSVALPKLVKDSEQKIEWENGSFIEVLSAEKGDVGRGGGRHYLLCDELAFWRNPALTLTATLNMVPKLSSTMVIAQSTANGVGGEFYDLWQAASDTANASGWAPLFFGWMDHPIYRLAVPDPARFQASMTTEERDLQQQLGLDLEQVHWRRVTIATECRGKADLFRQEYPSTAEEAFLMSGRPRFDMVSIRRQPLLREPLAGELERVRVGTRELVQLRVREDGHGALRVWKRPVPGRKYVIGGDTAQGIDRGERSGRSDPDYSAACVLDQETGEQVAQLRERMTPAAFAGYLCDLGHWYNLAYLVPEANSYGVAVIEELLRLQYPLERIYQRRRDPTDRRPRRLEDIGFLTTEVSKPQLISKLDRALMEGSIVVRDPVTAQELRTYVIDARGRTNAQEGSHDDCVIALALAVEGLAFAPVEALPRGQSARDEDDMDHPGRQRLRRYR